MLGDSRVVAEQVPVDKDKAICFSDRAHEHNLDGVWSPMHEVPKPDSYQCTNKLWRMLMEENGTPEMFCGAGSAQRETALPLEYTATSCTLPSLNVTDLLQLVRVRPGCGGVGQWTAACGLPGLLRRLQPSYHLAGYCVAHSLDSLAAAPLSL